jgi:RNA 3'-terminal phosphate cyclase (ATP)
MASSITIDGSRGEGGGQMLRTALSLAAVLGKPVRIISIRAGRPKPGLAAQHLTACRAVAAACGGQLAGDALRSQEIELTPGELRGGEFVCDVSDIAPSAGSVGLILQAMLPPLLFARQASHVVLRGGTDVPWSPVFTYLQEVFLPAVAHMGVQAELQRNRAGWYPEGGGEIEAWVEPLTRPLQPLAWADRGEGWRLSCHSTVSERLPRHIADRQNEGAAAQVPGLGPVKRREEQPRSGGPGTTCVTVATFPHGGGGFTALGERGKRAEEVGAEAGRQLRDFLAGGAAVDERLADQLQLYCALAAGSSAYTTPRLTGHLQTNADVIAQLTGARCAFSETGRNVRVDNSGLGWQPVAR